MPFPKTTLTEIQTRIQADLNSAFTTPGSRLRRSVFNVIAFMMAGAIYSLYGFLDFISRQVFPDTAEKESLNRWGSIWGIRRRPAQKAEGLIKVTGNEGAIIPAGTELQRSCDETRFTTVKDEAFPTDDPINIMVIASEFGIKGNMKKGEIITFISPPSGVESEAESIEDINNGLDLENDSDYLVRILRRIQQPPHGGAAFDYVTWALETPDVRVTRAWVTSLEPDFGYLTLRFMVYRKIAVSETEEEDSERVPTPEEIEKVRKQIESHRPITARAQLMPLEAKTLNFQIKLLTNNTPPVQAAIAKALREMILRDGKPNVTLSLSMIKNVISSVNGNYYDLVSPIQDVKHTENQIPAFGKVEFLKEKRGCV